MDYFLATFAIPVLGAAVLMTGILLTNRNRESSPYETRDTFKDCVAWGGGFFLTLSTEFMLLGNV